MCCKGFESDCKGLEHAFKGRESVLKVHEKPSPGLESADEGSECL
jgi:hypothetical protein